VKRKLSVLSLYTGAGGLDYGFEAAGFQTAVAVEMDHDCCETLRRNRKKWAVIEDDICNVTTRQILDRAQARPKQLDLLIGGPPCQPFSKAGYWARGDSRRLDDPRANTLAAYLRVLEEALPQAFVLENVEGLLYAGKDEGMRLFQAELQRINDKTGSRYRAHTQIMHAAEHGVPQLRSRVIVVGARDGSPFTHPQGRFAKQRDAAHPYLYRTAWDALADVVPQPDEQLALRGRWADLLPSIPEGKNYLYHTDRDEGLPLFGWRRRYWSFLLKLSKRLPSWTISAQPGPAIGPFHWSNRRLSQRELCRLQTFPDDVEIVGGRTSVQRQVGNAVPSLLAEVLGRAIRTQLFGLPALKTPLRLLPPERSPPPPPEPIAAVPKKFRALAGKYAPHPGTGQGAAALRRDAADNEPAATATQRRTLSA
jgi:DNA (cytosine-5)-methyltransferase 1